jgi:hypothetical protein
MFWSFSITDEKVIFLFQDEGYSRNVYTNHDRQTRRTQNKKSTLIKLSRNKQEFKRVKMNHETTDAI